MKNNKYYRAATKVVNIVILFGCIFVIGVLCTIAWRILY